MRVLRPGRRLQARLFVTCWLVFVLHFATDIVREHYLSFSLAEDYSFRMDKYLGLHVDIFDTPGHGAHIGNNPGVSMLGAIPYWVFRPLIDRIVRSSNDTRAQSRESDTAVYNDSRPRRVEFYRKVRQQGLDIQFGLAAGVIQALFMAPLGALSAVVILQTLAAVGMPLSMSLIGAFLYAFGTPIFFRTAFLNQNVFIAHLMLIGFVALWRPGGFPNISDRTAALVAGLAGGYSLLSDYSGGIVLVALASYALWTAWDRGGAPMAWRSALSYAAGAIGPILILLFYQWKAFGSPWLPGQRYMPDVEWVDIGYRGVGWPEWRLFKMLLFDTRFGLFIGCPWLVLSVTGLMTAVRNPTWLPKREAIFLAGFSLVFLVFFSAVQYTQLEWVTGVRYVLPIVPPLFLLAFVTLNRLPSLVRYAILVFTFGEAWCLSMVRATNISDSIARVLHDGLQLPWITVLSKMSAGYVPFLSSHWSPFALFAVSGLLVFGLWRYPEPETL